MKNIINEKPDMKLTGRLKFSTEFVSDKDITGKNILDIGCGFGWFELNMLNRGVKQIAGIEISAEDLKTAKTIKDRRAIFRVGGALKLPFPDNYFNTVVAWEVIEHIPKNTEDKMFKEVQRVLKKSGTFYLSTPYNSFWSTISDPAWWLIGHRHYSRRKLVILGKKSNFTVKEVYIKGRYWNLVGLLNMYMSKWILRRESLAKKLFEKKENEEYKDKNGFMNIFVKYEK
jgi:ubiquinone/menaquinone biosynthesis C-methylase UbiE